MTILLFMSTNNILFLDPKQTTVSSSHLTESKTDKLPTSTSKIGTGIQITDTSKFGSITTLNGDKMPTSTQNFGTRTQISTDKHNTEVDQTTKIPPTPDISTLSSSTTKFKTTALTTTTLKKKDEQGPGRVYLPVEI